MVAAASSLLFGASGITGQRLLPLLVGPTWCVSRAIHASSGQQYWMQSDLAGFRCPAECRPSRVFSLGPLPDFVDWLQIVAFKPEVIVALSSSSATLKANSPIRAERALATRLRDAEQRLLAYGASRDIHVRILRPTMIWGDGRCALSSLARLAAHTRVLPRPWFEGGLRAPVHCADLAHAAIGATRLSSAAAQVLPLGGGERLPIGSVLRRIARSVAALQLPMPMWALQAMATATRPRGLKMGEGWLARWSQPQVVDDAESWQQLGRHPRGFDPQRADWLPIQ